MLHCETFKVLLLAEICLYTWGAPLGSTSLPQARHSDRTEQGSRQTTGHLAGLHNGKLCMISQMQLHSSLRLPEWQEPGRIAEVLPSAKHQEEDAVTEVAVRQSRHVDQVHARAQPYAQYQDASAESIDESSPEDKNMSLSSATPSESTAAVDHSLEPGDVNPMRKLVRLVSTSTSVAGQINLQKYTGQSEKPSKQLLGVNTDRPAQTQVELGRSDNLRPGSLFHSNVEENNTLPVSFQPLTTAPSQEQEELMVNIKENISAKLNPKHWIGVSTEPQFFNQSPLAIGPVITSLTTSGSSNGQTRGATGYNERVAEDSLFTASEVQDKARRFLQPDLTHISRLADLQDTWTESGHLQRVEEASILPLSQEVGPEATMSSEDLPLIFAPFDDVTPPRSSALAFELTVAMAPVTGMRGEGELEQAVSMNADHTPSDASLLGPSDWPSPWQMSGAENSDALITSQMPINKPFSEEDPEHSDKTENLQNVIPTTMGSLPLSSSHAFTQQITDTEPTHLPELKPNSQLEELQSEEDEDKEDEDVEDSEEEEEEIGEDLSEAPAHTPTRSSYSLIPPPPIWGHQNQGLMRSWVELIREKAGYVSGMLAPVGIGIAGALLIVGALYGIRMIHRKRRNSFKHQRRKPREVRNGPDQAMLLADSSEDEL
ncbi:uncharacterized protein armh4 isoform X2 [Brachyhypopomus gauderio]|uniref:uncharacterized protein armh4 isoform X2 n=1 Tax=Brachyhypopomus gauderio TaxID=698409 RepID=UPI0040412C96